ncbi:hypothetical protein RYX36_026944 [Vicia faba]
MLRATLMWVKLKYWFVIATEIYLHGHIPDKILYPTYLDGAAGTFSSLKNVLQSSQTSAKSWVGEAGGAYSSGRYLVSNAFVNSFWYLNQLGMSATYGTTTYCRQTLIRGNYGLLNTATFMPNPDYYYSALLWHRLMGSHVLSTTFYGTKKIRTYAHCAKETKGVTILFLNLDNSTIVEARMSFHFGDIPPLNPIHVDPSKPVPVAPLSIVFTHIPDIITKVCS